MKLMGGFGMNAKKLKGMKVLDKNSIEIGKVSDLGINLDEFKIENILVSTGGFFSKKYFTVNLEDLGEIDNYIHLKCSKGDIDYDADLELRNSKYGRYFFKDFRDIYVGSADAIPIGQVKDLYINFDNNLTFKVVVEATRVRGRYKNDYFAIYPGDIDDIREFITLNLTKDEIKQKIAEFKIKD
jgi:sporulation protein YlmC with PRC-barrel domain